MRWILLSLALLMGAAHSQEAPKARLPVADKSEGAKKSKEGARGKQAIPVELPPTINVTVGGKLEMKAENHYDKGNHEGTNFAEWLVALFTGLLVVVTGWLVYYTKNLWASTKNLVDDANETAKHELRAYISAANGALRLIPGTTVLRAEVALMNSGRTPAHNVRYAITGAIRPSGELGDFPEQDLSTRKQPIAPNAHWTVGHEFIDPPLTAADIHDVESRKKWVYVWGMAKYSDIFGRTHTLKFRYRNVVQQSAFDPASGGHIITGWAFYPEDEGNEAT